MRLDDELAAVEGRFRAADFNLCPVAREHDALRISARVFDDDFRFRHVDGFALEASLHIRAKRPAEKQHFCASERQHRPEPKRCGRTGDTKGGETDAAEEQKRATRAQRAMRGQIDVIRGVKHGRDYTSHFAGALKDLRAYLPPRWPMVVPGRDSRDCRAPDRFPWCPPIARIAPRHRHPPGRFLMVRLQTGSQECRYSRRPAPFRCASCWRSSRQTADRKNGWLHESATRG